METLILWCIGFSFNQNILPFVLFVTLILRVFQILLTVSLVSLFQLASKGLRREKLWLANKTVSFFSFFQEIQSVIKLSVCVTILHCYIYSSYIL